MFDVSLKNTIDQLPPQPGVYRFYNELKGLIYVGKAKDLRKRVTSYFSRVDTLDKKTKKLVQQVRFIDYTLVPTEYDALLLENNLIKENQPKYNILLKDDKTFPFIVITNERFPKVITVRNTEAIDGIKFGPYTNVAAMNNVVELVTKLFQLRTCNYNLSKKNIEEKKFKVCLEYHLGNCKGPCEGYDDELEYNSKINLAQSIFKGNISIVKNYFKNQMEEYAASLEFEKAATIKLKLESLEKFHINTVIVNPTYDLSVYTISGTNEFASINYFRVLNGQIIQSNTIDTKKKLIETDEEILVRYIALNREHDNATEILVNIPIIYPDPTLKIIIPQIGDKKKLLTLSIKNSFHRLEKKMQEALRDNADRILLTLKKDLSLTELPIHIECFDNSNLQGTDAVSAMVCFKNGKPSKKDYRHFNVKTVEGPNDFGTMFEVITRRYKRCLQENLPLPQLIIVDGGKGQLSAAVDALKGLNLYGKVPIIGIAKNLEEIFFPGDQLPLYIDKKSESLKLIQQLRDEAHRFGITHHRNKRSKTSILSELDIIPEIGEASKLKLLKKFKNIKTIKEKSLEELSEVIGIKKAEILKTFLK